MSFLKHNPDIDVLMEVAYRILVNTCLNQEVTSLLIMETSEFIT